MPKYEVTLLMLSGEASTPDEARVQVIDWLRQASDKELYGLVMTGAAQEIERLDQML